MAQPWNILQICGASEGGSWFVDQVRELRRRGHSVDVIVPGEGSVSSRLRAEKFDVSCIPFRGYRPRNLPRLLRAQRRLNGRMTDPRYDIVHAHLLKAIVMARLGLRGRARPALVSQFPGVVHLTSAPLARIDAFTMRWDTVLVGSCRAFADQYERRGAKRVFVNHYGLVVGDFAKRADAGAFRQEQDLDPQTIAVGLVAHMYPTRLKEFREVGVKGHETFIDAAAALTKQGSDNMRFFIVGDEFVGDGSYRRALQSRADAAGVSSMLTFLGHREDIASVVSGLDILANPSMSESASYTMIEASLMKKPVIATRVGGLTDTVIDGTTGILIPPNDPEALAVALRTLAADEGLRRRLGIAGNRHVSELFDVGRTVDVLEGIYSASLGSR